jgi:hypothetical protein
LNQILVFGKKYLRRVAYSVEKDRMSPPAITKLNEILLSFQLERRFVKLEAAGFTVIETADERAQQQAQDK